MGRARKRHIQETLSFDGKRPRPRRKGAAKGGRPPKGPRSSERHEPREELTGRDPVHVVVRATREVRSLRRRDMYKALRDALVSTLVRQDFRVVHLSIQGTHVHLLVEAEHKLALARGMQALQISAARRINTALRGRDGKRRRGSVFPDRYHMRIIKQPRQARNTLAYVLNNWRKHRVQPHPDLRHLPIDLYSSAPSFDGWRDVDPRVLVLPDEYQPLPVWPAKTWLLRQGWRRHGLIASTEVPSGPTLDAALAE